MKKETWRILVGVLGILLIVFLWVKKDVGATIAGLPREQVLPMLATSIAVTLFKVALIAAAVFLVKWLMGKFSKK